VVLTTLRIAACILPLLVVEKGREGDLGGLRGRLSSIYLKKVRGVGQMVSRVNLKSAHGVSS
jgi:hypothetical protein